VQLDGFDQRRHLSREHGDILANPVDICFSSMPAKSTTPAACLVIESNAVTSNQ
jgi:hypothetical protein